MDISIYLKSTGQIISTRNINSSDDIGHLDTTVYGYVEGEYETLVKKWDGSSVVAVSYTHLTLPTSDLV